MEKVKNDLQEMDVIIFEDPSSDQSIYTCQLKNFLYFLNFMGVKRPIPFSYVSENGQFHNSLTLRENILLDSIPSTLSSTKEFKLNEYLEKSGNTYLIHLFKQLTEMDKYPTETDTQSRKIAALLKCLLKDSKFVLLERPEKHLNQELQEILLRTLEFESKRKKHILLVTTDRPKIWEPVATKRVVRGSKNKFSIQSFTPKHLSTPRPEREDQTSVLMFHNFPQGKNKDAA